jgi:hypothetical protein
MMQTVACRAENQASYSLHNINLLSSEVFGAAKYVMPGGKESCILRNECNKEICQNPTSY